MPKLKTMPAVISFSAKCSDLFSADFLDADKKVIASYEGYVPGFFPEEHYGDYVQLDVDLKTGKILNWEAPSLKKINDTFRDE